LEKINESLLQERLDMCGALDTALSELSKSLTATPHSIKNQEMI
jgi:hypothetical protein